MRFGVRERDAAGRRVPFGGARVRVAGAGKALAKQGDQHRRASWRSSLGAAFVARFLPRHSAQKELEARAAAVKGTAQRVTVSPPKLVSSERNLKLPASVQALEEAVLYSRANGFVARWLVDLGDKVKGDQLLAEIETPELNQELSQARASLAKAQAAKAQAEANRALAVSRFIRDRQAHRRRSRLAGRTRADPGRSLGGRR